MRTFLIYLFELLAANAQLTVTVFPPKVAGQKAVVPLAIRNGLTERVESVRAVVFLLDEQGKTVGQPVLSKNSNESQRLAIRRFTIQVQAVATLTKHRLPWERKAEMNEFDQFLEEREAEV